MKTRCTPTRNEHTHTHIHTTSISLKKKTWPSGRQTGPYSVISSRRCNIGESLGLTERHVSIRQLAFKPQSLQVDLVIPSPNWKTISKKNSSWTTVKWLADHSRTRHWHRKPMARVEKRSTQVRAKNFWAILHGSIISYPLLCVFTSH